MSARNGHESPAQPQDPAALLAALLGECVRRDASDLHFAPECPPYLRVEGELAPLDNVGPLSAKDVADLADVLLEDHGRSALARGGSVDGATSAAGARFRFNVARRQGALSVAIRRLEEEFRPLADLGLPDSLYELCDHPDGLVVVAGPTGAGKSTTLATLLDRINRTRRGHIVTIEDPIEYVHRPRRCLVNQREVGRDTPDFNAALVNALRQDPDVILVGEIRDLNTIRTAIVAAETGHLVLTTVHAGDCASAIERMVSVFPADEQPGIRRQLALVLRAVVTQHLLVADGGRAAAASAQPAAPAPAPSGSASPSPSASPSAARPGPRQRVVVSEVLRMTPAVANLIANAKSAQIYSTMESGAAFGMQTLEQDLARLWTAGRISEAAAVALARDPATLRDRAGKTSTRSVPRPHGGGGRWRGGHP